MNGIELITNTVLVNKRGLQIADCLDSMIAYWDNQEICRYANAAYLEWFGRSCEELIGNVPLKELLGSSYKEIKHYVTSVLSGTPQVFERDFFLSSGDIRTGRVSFYPDKDDDEIKGFFIHVVDLTPLKKLEQRVAEQAELIRKSEERYSLVLNEISDYAIIQMDATGSILDWNNGAERISGYTLEEITGKNFRIFYTSEDIYDLKPERLLRCVRKEGRAYDEGWRIRKDGTIFWGSITATPPKNPEGNTICYTIIIRDLSDRKKAESTKKAEERNKELEHLTYIASHDLQEPLRTINSIIELLTDHYKNDENAFVRNSFKFISEASNRMRLSIRALLDYSRLGLHAELKKVDCASLVYNVCSDMSSSINQSGTILHVSDLPTIYAYETELRLMFQNLISNAIKFRKPDVAPEIFISAEQQNGEWKFIVRDNGIGIAQQYKDRIFLIFQRLHAKDEYEGTGIGLAHCKRVAELHNGTIWFESSEGYGSTFYFTINTNTYGL